MEIKAERLRIKNWVMRVQSPGEVGPYPVFLLLHGWTGDENSMWIFSPRLPSRSLKIAPRALFSSPIGGYSWHPPISEDWPKVINFRLAIEELRGLLSPENFPQGDLSRINVVGFSQGAALAYTLALSNPDSIASVAGLSGFLPVEVGDLILHRPLEGIPVFITHGTQDGLVPVAKAQESVQLLERAGGKVTYCEDDVGHKLSATCFKGLEKFYT